MTAEERRHLTEVHDACRTLAEAGEVHAYYDANRRFHEVIYAGSHNAYLEETTRNMRNRLSPYRRFQLNHPGRIMKSWSEHRAVVDAIVGGAAQADRKSVVSGKSVSVRVALVGRRNIKKKKNIQNIKYK